MPNRQQIDTLELPQACDVRDKILSSLIKTSDIEIDTRAVNRIDLAGLSVLLSVVRSPQKPARVLLEQGGAVTTALGRLGLAERDMVFDDTGAWVGLKDL